MMFQTTIQMKYEVERFEVEQRVELGYVVMHHVHHVRRVKGHDVKKRVGQTILLTTEDLSPLKRASRGD